MFLSLLCCIGGTNILGILLDRTSWRIFSYCWETLFGKTSWLKNSLFWGEHNPWLLVGGKSFWLKTSWAWIILVSGNPCPIWSCFLIEKLLLGEKNNPCLGGKSYWIKNLLGLLLGNPCPIWSCRIFMIWNWLHRYVFSLPCIRLQCQGIFI